MARGFVKQEHGEFVARGLRWGFDIGLRQGCLKGRRVFSNYSSATTARASVSAAIQSRVAANRTVCLGSWQIASPHLRDTFTDYFCFPMGAVGKPHEPSVMRPTSDHTKTGLNAADIDPILKHSLDTYREAAHLLKRGAFMYVSDVADAFMLIPLAPWLWPFFLFRWFGHDDTSDALYLYCHLFGDFGTKGLPGTFKIFLVDVVIQTARSECIMSIPIIVYVDDCGGIGADCEQTRLEFKAFQSWTTAVVGVHWKESKDRDCAIPQLYIGFWWNSVDLTRTLEEKKVLRYLDVIADAAGSASLTLRDRQSLAGKIQRAILTFPPGAACLLVNCYLLMSGLTLPWHKRRTTKAEREDYAFVHDLLRFNAGKGYYSYDGFAQGPTVLSDASKSKAFSGGGWVSCDGTYDFFKYGTSAARKPIDYLEGDVVVRACKSEGHKWHMQLVDFGVDNMAFERSAEKGRSRAPRLNELCKALFYLQVRHTFILQMFWLSTHDNFLADHLSRDRHEEFLQEVPSAGLLRPGAVPQPVAGAGRVVALDEASAMRGLRQLLTGCSSNSLRDGPGRGHGVRGDAQLLSVHYDTVSLFDGLPPELEERVDEVLDFRLAPNSRRKVLTALKRWRAVCDERGWPALILSGDPSRGGRMATWVTQMVDDTDLTFASISTYVWGMRTWHVLQHQADPAMGVMHWKEFMSGVAVMTAVPGEPRKELPFEVMCDMLRMLQKSDSFKDKQLRLMLLTLLFTFSRTECPCPKTWNGADNFDPKRHWTVADFKLCVDRSTGRYVLWVRFKGIKQDPRIERPSAKGNSDAPFPPSKDGFGNDWVPIGDVPDTMFSIAEAYKAVVQAMGRSLADDECMFWNRDKSKPYTYQCLKTDLYEALQAVGADTNYGPHGIRVLGYNRSKLFNGVDITVAHGGWFSEGHERYERFAKHRTFSIPANMVEECSVFVSGERPVSLARGTRGSGVLPVPEEMAEEAEDGSHSSDEDGPSTGFRRVDPPGYCREERVPLSGKRYPVWRGPDGAVFKSRAEAWRHFTSYCGHASDSDSDADPMGTPVSPSPQAARSGAGSLRSRLAAIRASRSREVARIAVIDTPPPPAAPGPAPDPTAVREPPLQRRFDFVDLDPTQCGNPACRVPSVNGRHAGPCVFPAPPPRR